MPLQRNEPIGVESLRDLARQTFGTRDPAGFFTHARPIRLSKRGQQTVMEIDLKNAETDELDVALRGNLLHVKVRDAQRRISLPDSLAGRSLGSARMIDGVLEIAFDTQ